MCILDFVVIVPSVKKKSQPKQSCPINCIDIELLLCENAFDT